MTEETKVLSDAEFAEFRAFVKEFIHESDRAAVILGAAKIDIQLYQILQKVLVPCASGRDELLDGENPLSSFRSRIDIIYRLGLIDAQFAWALHLIRKIRNAFAHELSGVNLVAGPQGDRIRELVSPLTAIEGWDEFKKLIQGMRELEEASADFRTVVSYISVRLHRLFVTAQTLTTENAFSFVLPQPTNSLEMTEVDENQPE